MMLLKLQRLVMALCGGLLLTSCVNKSITVNEVLQQKIDDKDYTACNLWYDDDNKISGLNYMEGTLLPIGTVITAEKGNLYLNTMTIHDANGTEYTLEFAPDNIITPPYKLISQIFTLSDPEHKISQCSAETAAAIRKGEVIRGMTRDEVLLCWGRPNPSLTPDLNQNTWIYNISRYEVVRVLFSGDKVTRLLSINPQLD